MSKKTNNYSLTGKKVTLLSEINLKYFIVERSEKMVSFYQLTNNFLSILVVYLHSSIFAKSITVTLNILTYCIVYIGYLITKRSCSFSRNLMRAWRNENMFR